MDSECFSGYNPILQLYSLLQLPEQQSSHFPALFEQEFLFKHSATALFAKLLVKLTIIGTGAAPYVYLLVTKVLHQREETLQKAMEIQLLRREKITISGVSK